MKTTTIKKRIYKPTFWQRLRFWKLYQKIEISIPESWNEVKESDFLLLFQASLEKEEGLRRMKCIAAVLPSEIRDEVHLIDAFSLLRMSSFMAFCEPRKMDDKGNWLYEEDKLLNNLPFDRFEVKHGKNMFLPFKTALLNTQGKDLEHITCENFRDASLAYGRLQSGKQEAAWTVIRVLTGWKVEANYMARFIKYPLGSVMIRYFGDCMEKIYQDINRISPTFFNSNTGESRGESIDFGWDGVFLEVAKDGVFGTYNDVLKSRFHDVMVYSVKKYEDALAQQRELEKQQNERN